MHCMYLVLLEYAKLISRKFMSNKSNNESSPS